MDDALGWLHDNGFILRYQVDGGRYIAVLNFLKHQKPHKHEQKSDIPAPTLGKSHGRRVRVTTADGGATTGQSPTLVVPTTANGGSPPASSLTPSSLTPDSLLSDSLSCPEAGPAVSGPKDDDPVVMEFPCKGTGRRSWPLVASKLAEYRDSFPGVDLDAELRKARQWCCDNPSRQKTYDGMAKFLGGWLGRAQDTARPSPRSPPGRATLRDRTVDPLREFIGDQL